MTGSERAAAVANAEALQAEIERAQAELASLAPDRQRALRAGFDHAENEAIKLVRLRRRELAES
ncbi:MAG TPA: hypothetical protein VNA20_07430 [Frankiaceae bacterium]|nr:hypothetical protein [Frankiaceae bacterium]